MSDNEKPEEFLYFAQKDNSNIWKIGRSKNPMGRKNQLQTGNDGTIYVRYVLENGKILEKYLKRALKKYKTRDKGNNNKGEWFVFSPEFVKALVRFLKEQNCNINEKDIPGIKDLALECLVESQHNEG